MNMAQISCYILKANDDNNAGILQKEFICSFCGESTKMGSFYHGAAGQIVLCPTCLCAGKVLGMLIGDGLADIRCGTPDYKSTVIQSVFDKTKLGAYYSLTWSLLNRW